MSEEEAGEPIEARLRRALGLRSIVLVGLMGAGKSTVGRRLASRLGLIFKDADFEIEAAAVHATQPMIREHEHADRCRRIVAGISMLHATSEEQDRAREAARKALAALPVGTSQAQLERAKETADAPIVAEVARRKEAAERKAVERRKRQEAD